MTPSFTQARVQLAPLGALASGFYSISEAVAMTKTGAETIRRAIRAGRIPAYGTRGHLRVRLCDVTPEYVSRRIRADDRKC